MRRVKGFTTILFHFGLRRASASSHRACTWIDPAKCATLASRMQILTEDMQVLGTTVPENRAVCEVTFRIHLLYLARTCGYGE